MKIFLLSFLLFLISPLLIFSQWTLTKGPEGVSISTLTTIDDVIYAGTTTFGLYASYDDGNEWDPLNVGMENMEVSAVVSHNGYLYAGTFGYGVYTSTDGGQTWLEPQGVDNMAVTAMVVNDPYVFAGTIDNGIYRSSDNGVTWESAVTGFSSIMAMCVNNNNVFASIWGYTIKTSDNGETWSYVESLEGAGIFSYYSEDNVIIAGSVNEIFKSTDNGNTFTGIGINIPYSLVNIYAIESNGTELFMGTSYDGIYKSQDMGETWIPANEGMGPKDVRGIAVTENATIIAGTNYAGIYRSENNGEEWEKRNNGFYAGSTIASLLWANNTLFAGTRGDGIYRSSDNSENWVKLSGTNDTINYATVQGMCEKDGVIYAGTRLQFSSTVYKTYDNGSNWIKSGTGLPNNLTFIFSMVTSGENILASTDEGIFYSSDDGHSWNLANVPTQYIPSMAAGEGYVYAAVSSIGVYRSANNGIDWVVSLQNIDDCVEVAAIDNYAYAGTFFDGARISTNYGSTWSACYGFPGDASVFALAGIGEGMVLAGTDQGPDWIYASFDNGFSFTPYSEGLAENAPVESFAVNDTFMFAGADYYGVWRRVRPGVVGIPNQYQEQNTWLNLDIHPNPFKSQTTISYSLHEASWISVEVYSTSGEKVKTLVNSHKPSGQYDVSFYAEGLKSGIYLCYLFAGKNSSTKKLIIRE